MANALESASLVMIPSGYEDGTLGSLKPTDGTGDFTFSRGSNTSATRINEQGYIEKGYENTLLASNDFARDDSSYTITSGEQGYDGTTDAWLVNKLVTGNAYFGKNGSVYTGVMTISFHLKAGTLDRLAIITTGDYVVFDLANVTATKFGGAPITQTIELVSGTTDWYRCSMVINRNETNNILLKPYNTSNQDAAGTIYIQDAMLNQGLVAYPYIETTTAPVAGGILEDMPRLDWSGSCPSLLLEPSRTNLIAEGEYFNGLTSQGTITLSANYATSPEGYNNATLFTAGSTSAAKRWDIVTNSGVDYSISIFLKNVDSGRSRIETTSPSAVLEFIWSDGVPSTDSNSGFADVSYTDYGNGWYRISAKVTATSTSLRLFLYPDRINGTDSILVYGAQIEQDATYPTSYIPTYGVSQTRLGDNVSNLAGLDSLNNEATIMAEFKVDSTGSGYSFQSSGASSYANFSQYTQERLRMIVRFEGVNQFVAVVSNKLYPDTWYKIILRYSTNAADIFLNGENIITRTGTWTLEPLDNLTWNFTEGNETKQLLVFPTALSDSECIALTTI